MAEDRKALKLKTGCVCSFGDLLFEEYEAGDGYIKANVSIDKIEKLVQYFVMVHDEPMTFTLNLPVDEEADAGVVAYEIERCSVEDMLLVMIRAGKVLFEDGVSSFEIEGDASGDRISFGRFNVMEAFGQDLEFVEDFFGPHKVRKVDKVTTAFDIISGEAPEVPGGDDEGQLTWECRVYEDSGKTVFDLPEKLAEMGMRPAGRSVS